MEAVTKFDPTPYLRELRGRGGSQEYLDVKWRVLWLRREHPGAEILTEHIKIDDRIAIFRATVRLPTGGLGTGYGSEVPADFGDYIEKAETKALGRALRALGYGDVHGEPQTPENPNLQEPMGTRNPKPRQLNPPASRSPESLPSLELGGRASMGQRIAVSRLIGSSETGVLDRTAQQAGAASWEELTVSQAAHLIAEIQRAARLP